MTTSCCSVLKVVCCAAVASTCGINGTDCSLQVYVGASGNDKNGIAFSSGWMIQEINRFSVYSLYDNSKQDVSPHSLICALSYALPYLKLANGIGATWASILVFGEAVIDTHAGCLQCSQNLSDQRLSWFVLLCSSLMRSVAMPMRSLEKLRLLQLTEQQRDSAVIVTTSAPALLCKINCFQLCSVYTLCSVYGYCDDLRLNDILHTYIVA